MPKKSTDMRTRRLELGIPQAEVADRAAVRETDLRKWERGLALPDGAAAERIALVLGIDAARLLQAQAEHAESATPGEGYTTAEPGEGEVVARRSEPPSGSRRVLDIFCGSGGLSFGFEQSGGFATSCGIDLLPDRIETFVTNHEYATGIAGDLRAHSLHELHRLTGEVDVVVGGPPCQGFSSIRPFRNLTEGDPRNSLTEHYVLVINHLRPAWFVFENVVGILTHEGGTRLQSVLEGLRAAGYTIDWRVVNAALFGVPQYRERVVIVGNRIGVPFIWPKPTHRVDYKGMAGARREVMRTDPLFSVGLSDAVTLMEAIDDLPAIPSAGEATEYSRAARTEYQRLMRECSKQLTLHKATKHSAKMLEIIRHAGANISALPPGMVKSGFSSCYSRLDADRPSTTLTVNFVHPASNRCIHPHQDRALTPREGARIQSFPDRFEFKGTSAQIVKQIGNAVPPLLGQRIAEAILHSEQVAKSSSAPRMQRGSS
jgi:DNA (cytosine-5)-methyltransferase 1